MPWGCKGACARRQSHLHKQLKQTCTDEPPHGVLAFPPCAELHRLVKERGGGTSVPGWGIAVIVIGCVLVLAAVASIAFLEVRVLHNFSAMLHSAARTVATTGCKLYSRLDSTVEHQSACLSSKRWRAGSCIRSADLVQARPRACMQARRRRAEAALGNAKRIITVATTLFPSNTPAEPGGGGTELAANALALALANLTTGSQMGREKVKEKDKAGGQGPSDLFAMLNSTHDLMNQGSDGRTGGGQGSNPSGGPNTQTSQVREWAGRSALLHAVLHCHDLWLPCTLHGPFCSEESASSVMCPGLVH